MQSNPHPADVQALQTPQGEPVDAFMRAAFAPMAEGEKAVLTNAKLKPDGTSGWRPERWLPGAMHAPLGLHFNCVAFKQESSSASLADATRAFVVMLDDLGDMPGKSHAPLDSVLALPAEVRPHAIIATRREGNYINCQACWFVHPVSPATAQALVKSVVKKKGGGDPQAISPIQWARLPGSLKLDNNGFPAEFVMSNLDAPRVGIGALAAALGVPGFLADEEQAAGRREASRGDPPDAASVRAAMATLANDLDRKDWVRLGLALKACCGPPPALDDADGLALFDVFSRQHRSYDARKTARMWRTARPKRIGFGTIVHHLKQQVLEIGSGGMDDDPVCPRTPACVLAPDATLARAAMAAMGTTHALVVPEFNKTLARYAALPEAASRALVIHRGTNGQRAGAAILLRRLLSFGVATTARVAASPNTRLTGTTHD